MQVTPALPWTDETEGGVIQLANPLTFEEILNGAITFTLENDGVEVDPVVNEGSSGIVIKEPTNNTIIYYIPRFEASSNQIQIVRESEAPAGFYLTNVELTETLSDGIYSTNYERGANWVFQVDGSTVRPVYGTQSSPTSVEWWQVRNDALQGNASELPFPNYSMQGITDMLDRFGGSHNLYQIDRNGVQMLDLTMNDIIILNSEP